MLHAQDGMPGATTRRTALGALVLATAAVPLAACGIRLEDDAPRVPLLPTREPVPGEAFLLSLWLGSGDLAALAGRVGGAPTALPARLATLHRAQSDALRTLLGRQGVPEQVVRDAQAAHRRAQAAATTSSTGTPTPAGSTAPTGTAGGAATPAATTSGTATPPGPATPAQLADAEAHALAQESFAGLADLPRSAAPVAAAALAQRGAAATLLGNPVTWAEQPAVPAGLAAAALDATRAAAYGLEVVAAQSRDAQRTLAITTLVALRARATSLAELAKDAATPPSLGYPLPFAVTNPAAARRLAVHVLGGLRASHAAATRGVTGEASALASCVQWLAEAEILAYRWRMPLNPFPGLA